MTKETYSKMTEWFLQRPKAARLLELFNRVLTAVVFCAYPAFLLWLLVQKDAGFWRAVFVPAISFAAVSVFRCALNCKRPYERFGTPPVLKKDTAGKSFPSRHIFSTFVIAATVFAWNPGAGIFLGVIGLILAAIRVLGGVHTAADVAVGMVLGILSGVIGYALF